MAIYGGRNGSSFRDIVPKWLVMEALMSCNRGKDFNLVRNSFHFYLLRATDGFIMDSIRNRMVNVVVHVSYEIGNPIDEKKMSTRFVFFSIVFFRNIIYLIEKESSNTIEQYFSSRRESLLTIFKYGV